MWDESDVSASVSDAGVLQGDVSLFDGVVWELSDRASCLTDGGIPKTVLAEELTYSLNPDDIVDYCYGHDLIEGEDGCLVERECRSQDRQFEDSGLGGERLSMQTLTRDAARCGLRRDDLAKWNDRELNSDQSR